MTTFSLALGYPSQIWLCLKQALQVVANLPATNTSANRATLRAVASTLINGRDSLTAWQISTALYAAYTNLSPIQSLTITLSPTDLALVTARIASVRAMSLAFTALLPAPTVSAPLVSAGLVGLPAPGVVDWCMQTQVETPPTGNSIATLLANSVAEANAWDDVVTALQTQGVVYTGSTLDTCNHMAVASRLVSSDLASMTVNTSYNPTTAWNGLVAIPSLLRLASNISSDPTSDVGQQVSLMKYVIGLALQNINTALVNLRETIASSVVLAKVRANDTLMDIAAREMGDYTRWQDIAKVNGLEPPYIVPVRPTDGSAVAAWGDEVFLPVDTNTTQANTKLNYETDYLGTDLDLGPINGIMPTWTGDFTTITGYDNLRRALGRRVQTSYGTLIYHSDYGSRIPPEVGSVQTQTTIGHIEAYAVSALTSDPRVNEVSSVSATVLPNFGLRVEAAVVPNGLTGGVSLNEVLQPSN